jgi:4-amino-4-deoxy-L-arabinose transferase-like glycosyltransferase
MKGKSSPAILAAAILAIGFAAMLALNLPGQLSYDSVSQLLDGRSASYNSWHPAVMAWLLGLFDAMMPGTALYLIFEAGLLGLALSLSLSRRANWGAPLVALGLVLTPQFLLFQGTVWKDVLFTDAFVLAFAALARGVSATKPNWLLLALFFACLSLAALARQNGIVLLPVGAGTLAWAMARNNLHRWLLAATSRRQWR